MLSRTQTTIRQLRVFAFIWHVPSLDMLSRTGHIFEVADTGIPKADGKSGWRYDQRPLPPNVVLLPSVSEAAKRLAAGVYDLAMAQTPFDIQFLSRYDTPAIYLAHNRLQTEIGGNSVERGRLLRATVLRYLDERGGLFCAISPGKLATWDMNGYVLPVSVATEDWGGYSGEKPATLTVGNLLAEREHMFNTRLRSQIVSGFRDSIIGFNPGLGNAQPSANREALLAAYQSHRVYVHVTMPEWEDGYNMALLEAMATGMPVVSWANPTSPIVDGVNGFVADDVGYLRKRIQQLLSDRDLARAIGIRARQTVAEKFDVKHLVEACNNVFPLAIEQWEAEHGTPRSPTRRAVAIVPRGIQAGALKSNATSELPSGGVAEVEPARLNPIDAFGHPICLRRPLRVTYGSAWHQHIPFAMYLVDLVRPSVIVELGTYRGDSYCAFCQAVRELRLPTRCYGIDTWQGDPHTGYYGADVLLDLCAHHDPLYGSFSTLVKATFDEAVRMFPDGSIDLLHIDGYHTYDAVRHDFYTWLPKLSERGIVLLHDTDVRDRDFGVWRLWEELKRMYPNFEFHHGFGLGVLCVGKSCPTGARRLFALSKADADRVREFFEELGRRIAEHIEWPPGTPATRVVQPVGSCGAMPTTGEVGNAPDGSQPVVSIIIPTYNNRRYTEQCLKAINDTAAVVSHEVIVVDNGSTDGTPELIGKLDIPVRLVRNDVNRGFAAACNQGAAVARGRYLVFLNNDTVPKSGWLKALLDTAERPGVGIVGARLLYPDGRVQHAGVELINGIPDHPFRLLPGDAPQVTHERELDMVTGACLMISRDLFTSLGGFDEVYRNGVEDVDLCLRVRRAGYKVIYQPAAVVVHYESQTPGRFRYGRENVQIFARRWKGAFDGRGRLLDFSVPKLMISERSALRSNDRPRVAWEGSQFVHHSLALVNRELCLQLMGQGQELSIVPYEPDQFTASVDARFGKLADRVGASLSGPADVHVRHQWPPNFTPPPEGHWVMIQPWEFGSLPRRWVEVMSKDVDEVWVPSTYVRDCYVRSGVPSDRVQVVPNGVDPKAFRPDAPPMNLAPLGVTEKRFKFLFVGGTIWRKGIDVLLRAYTKAFSSADDVCLVIKDMGGRSFYRGQTFEQEIRRLQARPEASAIVYLDQDLLPNELPGLYRACDCLVHPYRGEGFGLPIAEAMACGLPVIVTNYGAGLDFCSKETAYLIPASEKRLPERRIGEWETVDYPWVAEPDVEELARLMRHVYEHQEEARAKGLRASQYIRTNFTWEKAAQKVIERIEALRQRPIRRFQHATTISTQGGAGSDDRRTLLLAETRAVHFLLMPDWNDPQDAWLVALEQFVQEFGPTEDVAVLLRVDPEEVPDTDTVASRLQEWAKTKGLDSDDGHLVLLVNDRLGPRERHLVYDAAHVFIPTSTSEKGAARASEARERGLLICEPTRAAMKEAWKAVLERKAIQTTAGMDAIHR